MELIKQFDKTYYIKNAVNIGVYRAEDRGVYLIDTGNDTDSGKKVLKILNAEGLTVKGIINTHSHADHIGGNKVIEDRTGCETLAFGIEKCFTRNPILEPSFLYGGFPFEGIKNKFLRAKESNAVSLEDKLPKGLEYFPLKGHSFDMIGIKTDDGVYFLGDSLSNEQTINKYHLFFIYDVKEYLNTLDFLSSLNGRFYIPSHCEPTDDISGLIELNRDKIYEISDRICRICESKSTFEEILKRLFDEYGLNMNANQYVLVGSTVKSYLSYLCGENRLGYSFEDNKMLWQTRERCL